MDKFGIRNSEFGIHPANPSGRETETGTGWIALVSGRDCR